MPYLQQCLFVLHKSKQRYQLCVGKQKLALCMIFRQGTDNAIRQSVVKLKNKISCDAIKDEEAKRKTYPGTWYIISWHFRALCLHNPRLSHRASKLDKSKTTQYKSHNMANS